MTLTTNLSNEVSRATTAESTLTTNLGAEVTRAEGAEATLSTGLGAETTRAEGAESTLTTNLNNEVTRATTAEATKANLDGGNTFTGGKQKLAPSTTTYPSLNVPNTGAAPTTPAAGDLWLTGADTHLQFQDKNNATHGLMFTDDR